MNELAKHIDKKKRQYCINFLERFSRKLFKMFRDENTTKDKFVSSFVRFKKKLDPYSDVALYSPYHRKLRDFVQELEKKIKSDFDFDVLRSPSMTQLNRLQKLKNATIYKKDKYKNTDID